MWHFYKIATENWNSKDRLRVYFIPHKVKALFVNYKLNWNSAMKHQFDHILLQNNNNLSVSNNEGIV